MRLTDLLSKKGRSVNLMAMWRDYGMFGFCINSNIKSKHHCSYRIVVKLTNLFSKKQSSNNCLGLKLFCGVAFIFCIYKGIFFKYKGKFATGHFCSHFPYAGQINFIPSQD